jgi:hypothetical protein
LQHLQNFRRKAKEAQDKAVADALLVGLSCVNDHSTPSDQDCSLQSNDEASLTRDSKDSASGTNENLVASASASASASVSSAAEHDVLLKFSPSHHLKRVDGILTEAPVTQGELVSDKYRCDLPVTDAEDEVHLEGDVMSEIGRQRGIHTIEKHFFSLRTVKSTGEVLWNRNRTKSAPTI